MLHGGKRTDLFDVIIGSHRHLLALSQALEGPPPGPDPPERRWRAAAQRLVIEESRHELAEEEYLWPVVRDVLEGGEQLAQTGLRQERNAKRLLARLDRAAGRAEPLDGVVPELLAVLEAHVGFENREILPPLRATLDEELADRLGSLLLHAQAVAPTRPRPHVPAVPGLLRLSGPMLGRADRIRDLLTLRGR